MPVLDRLSRCGLITFRQPLVVAVLPKCQVGLRLLFGVPLLVIYPVLFQNHRQSQSEHFQAQHVLVNVGPHIYQIGVIEIVMWLWRGNIDIPHKHFVRLRQRFQIAAKIKCRVAELLHKLAYDHGQLASDFVLNVKQSYLQCVNVFCSAKLRTTESID